MTCFQWNGVGDDPNRPMWLCNPCKEEYIDYMQECWDEYHAGVL